MAILKSNYSNLSSKKESKEEVPLRGAQQGLVFETTLEEAVVHWPGDRLLKTYSTSSKIVIMVELLPHQSELALSSTKMATTAKPYFTSNSNSRDHSREVFKIKGINKHDEEEADISSDKNRIARETGEQKATRRCRNRQCAQRRLHAQHRQEAREQYEVEQRR